MKEKEYIFKDLLDDKDFLKIQQNSKAMGLTHPIIYLLEDENERVEASGYCAYSRENTKAAIARLRAAHEDWLKKTKKKLLDKNRENVSATLGEIRCFGYLAETFGSNAVSNISESKTPTPDFQVCFNGYTVIVEVNTVQINENEANSLKKINNQIRQPSNEKIRITEHISHPYGLKTDASTTQSVILKMKSVKEKNHQLTDAKPSILWVDLQDEYMNMLCDRIDKSGPFFSGKGYGGVEGIISNELWFSLYSKTGDPVFEGESLNSDCGREVSIKENIHFGKFNDPKYRNLSAVVFSGPNSVVFYENPRAKNKIPNGFVERLSSGRWFKIESCRMNYPNKQLRRVLRVDKNALKALSKKKFYS